MTTRAEEHAAVSRFTFHMLSKLRANAWKGDWLDDDAESLLARAKEELSELEEALAALPRGPMQLRKIIREAADVANMVMMVADLCERDLEASAKEPSDG